MVRFPLLFLILLTTFGLSQSAGAQGVFDFEPDTLFYTDSGEVVMTNVSPDTVVLDSMSMYWGNEESFTAWHIWGQGDPPNGLAVYFNGWSEYPDTLAVDLTFAPQDSLLLTFAFDSCTVCLSGWVLTDTLVFHSNGQFGNDSLLLDTSQLIADEEGPEDKPSISLKTMPNPSAGLVEVQLSLATASEVSVSIFDTRGRQIAVLQDGPLISGEHTFMWDSSGAAPGNYYIRARTPRGGPLSRSVVVTR